MSSRTILQLFVVAVLLVVIGVKAWRSNEPRPIIIECEQKMNAYGEKSTYLS